MLGCYFIYSISIILSSSYAYWISSKKINNSLHKQNSLIYIFFALNFSLSIGLFALMMQEILVFKEKADVIQEKLWLFEIKFLNFNILFLGPVLMIIQCASVFQSHRLRVFTFLSFLLIYFYFLVKCLYQEADNMVGLK